ncbi:MAG: hypothetical protein WC505_03310 [Patescibacteria group bacterium]
MKTKVGKKGSKNGAHELSWFNERGRNMIPNLNLQSCTMSFHSPNNFSMLIISRVQSHGDYHWRIEWKMRKWQNDYPENNQSGSSMQSEVIGTVYLTDDDFKDAFALKKNFGAASNVYVACPCVYVRYRRYLNIPCIGTGMDGDPNISLYISVKVQRAIRQLYQRSRK